MFFRQITDDKLAQYAYLIGCQKTGEALVIDPERDVDRYVRAASAEGLRVTAVAETHIHADFLSGARDLAAQTGAHLYLSAEGEADGWGSRWAREGSLPVTFLRDGDTFRVGNLEVRALHTPGHTPEHLSFLITDHGGGADAPMGLVSGDFVFVGDLGRPDLLESAAGEAGAQGPAARALYQSVQRFLDLDDALQVWPGHGAGSACGKALGAVPQSTVGYERRFNAAIDAAHRGEDAFADAILDAQPEPPLYFARMKRLNRDGVPPLTALPQPRALGPDDLAALPEGAVVVDTRADRAAFMDAHLPGSLYAPLDRQFNTIVGSYVTDPEAPLVLILDGARVEEAVRDLVRIGLDRIVAYATPETLAAYAAAGGATARIEAVRFEDVAAHRDDPGVAVLDVRRTSEYAAGHVPGAANAAHTRLAGALDRVPEADMLYVHCQAGGRAATASAFLAREGYNVRFVNDGFAHYREIGPVETGAPAEAAA
jgi:hydroxyacylglutathione hydrolase